MADLTARVDIYSYSGNFPSAVAVSTAALAITKEDQDCQAMRRIHIGMGYMVWGHDSSRRLRSITGGTGSGREDDGHDDDRAASLVGLGDCRQRHGNYRRAVMDALGLRCHP